MTHNVQNCGRLSLCMIVKNEANMIGKCLQNVKEAVDEMIIVDTGSTDGTQDICRSHGAQLFDLAWQDDFAAARNYGLRQATGDWILWLDADEQVDPGSALQLRQIFTRQNCDLGCIELINYVGSEPASDSRAYVVNHHRLFRNRLGFQFKGAIHEHLNVDEVLGPNFKACVLPVKVRHYGYMDEQVQSQNKAHRNIRILEMEKCKEDYSPWIDYHLSSEYYRLQQFKQAFDAVSDAIRGFIVAGKKPPSLCYKMKYDILLATGSYEGAWPAIDRAIQLYPDYVDLYYYKGLILYHLDKTEQALAVFEQCLVLGETNLWHLTLRGVGSFLAWHYIGLCHERMGRRAEAIEAFKKCLEGDHAHTEAVKALGRLLTKE